MESLRRNVQNSSIIDAYIKDDFGKKLADFEAIKAYLESHTA